MIKKALGIRDLSVFALITLLILAVIRNEAGSWGVKWLVSAFYSANFTIAIRLVHQYLNKRFAYFSSFETWMLRTLLYLIAVFYAYVAGFLFQNYLMVHDGNYLSFIITGGLEILLRLATIPFMDIAIGDIVTRETKDVVISFLSIFFLISLIIMLASYIEIRWRSERQKQLDLNAELKIWRSQIEPHFLFNSINTIVSTVKPDPHKAEQLLIKLSELLRFIFNQSGRTTVSLAEELEFTRNYLDLIRARYPQKLTVNWQIEIEDQNKMVPSLLIQPLVENAIKHGWKNKDRDFQIDLRIEPVTGGIKLVVEDNGAGIAPDRLKQLPQKGHALENISQRLNLISSWPQSLKIESRPEAGTKVIIKIPEQ